MFRKGMLRGSASRVQVAGAVHVRLRRRLRGWQTVVLLALTTGLVFGVTGVAHAATVVPDQNLAAAINAALGHPADSDITTADMANLGHLYIYSVPISSLEGMQYATDLQGLALYNIGCSDISQLASCTALTNLELDSDQITDVGPLSGLTNLTELDLDSDQITDLSPLSGLTNLTDLALGGNQITDVGPLSGLTNLTTLNLDFNQIADVGPLSGLTNLTDLELTDDELTDVGPLSGLTTLTTLDLRGNRIADVGPLSGLTNLTDLDLSYDRIADVGPLSGLTTLTDLNLGSNEITDTAPLSGLTNLTDLDLSSDQIADLSPLSGLTALTDLNLGSNEITNTAPLSGLTNLTDLDLSYDRIADIGPLSGLTTLRDLNLCSDQIADVGPLSGLTTLTDLNLGSNEITDTAPLSGLTALNYLYLDSNQITDVSALSGLTAINELYLQDNLITDMTPLADLSSLSILDVRSNDLDLSSGSPAATTIETLNGHGAFVWSYPQNATNEVVYTAGPGGSIEGVAAQAVFVGENCTTVTAMPDPGYSFVDWSDGNTSATRDDTDVTGPMWETANFASNTHTLSYVAGPGGSIEGSSTQVVNAGSVGTTVTAMPDAGHHFVAWSDENANAARIDTATADATYTASFAINTISGPTHVTYGISSTTATRVRWIGSEGTTGYSVFVSGVLKGTVGSAAESFTIPAFLGPRASITVEANGAGGICSDPVRATYLATTPVKVATVTFKGGSAALTTRAKAVLHTLAKLIAARGFTTMTVNGYTRKVLTAAYRHKLSLARATSVKAYLMAQFKALHVTVAIKIFGLGAADPVGGNPRSMLDHRAEAIVE